MKMRHDLRFTKYQACGNDFILRDETEGARTSDSDRSKLAALLCQRHFWVGADGILFVERAGGLDGSMRLFEPDGKEADMCGNGLRCVAAHLISKFRKDRVEILTRDGVKRVTRIGNEYQADMGKVRTSRKDLSGYLGGAGHANQSPVEIAFRRGRGMAKGYMLNTGEPHLVLFVDDVEDEDLCGLGSQLSRDRVRFPKGTNVDLVEVRGPHDIRIRTYERGVFDETLACGTGATASAGAALLLERVRPGPVKVETRGGVMTIEIDARWNAYMTGPALPVFEGRLTVEL